MVKLIIVLALALMPPQEAPDVTVGLRPTAIRVGDIAVLTVRIVSRGQPVDWVDFNPSVGVEVEDVRERTSTHVIPGGSTGYVLEVEFDLMGIVAGEHQLPPVVVYWAGSPFETQSPALRVNPTPLQWGVPRRRPREDEARAGRSHDPRSDRVLHEGMPPQEGETSNALPLPNHTGQGGMLLPGAPGYGSGSYWSSFPGQHPQAIPSNLGGYLFPGMGIPGAYPGLFYPPGSGYPGGMPLGYGPTGNPGNPAWIPGDSTGGSSGSTFGGYPYGSGYQYGGVGGGYPYGMMGTGWGWPPSSPGWASTARSDPWWPELIPELLSYQSTRQGPEGLLTLSSGLTPDAVYVGQQVTYVATVSLAPGALLRLGGDPEYLPPSPEGFWAVDIPELSSGTPVAAQGEVLQAYTFKRSLFPLEAGAKLIPPAQVVSFQANGTAGMAGAVAPTVLVESDPLPVRVLPLPLQDAPPGFGGAVGRFRIEAFLTPAQVAVGETAVLTVRILGAGNVQGLPTPEIGHFPEVEVSPFSDWAVPEVQDGVVGGVKTFNWLLVPVSPGSVRLGPILYPYFDPHLGGFALAETSEIELTVTELPSVQEGGFPPGNGGFPPAQGGLPPAQSGVLPAGGGSPPAQGGFQPPQDVDSPAQSGVLPADGGSPPVQSGLHPGVFPSLTGPPEGEIEARMAKVISNPRDAEAWFNLGEAYSASQHDQGRSTWAFLSASRLAPRDPRIGAALTERGMSPGGPDPPFLPVSARESLLLGGLLLLLGGAGAAVLAFPSLWPRKRVLDAVSGPVRPLPGWRRTGLLAGGLTWLGAFAFSLSPWIQSRIGAEHGVVVGEDALLRAEPFLGSPSIARWGGGTTVSLAVGDRFGWAKVQGDDGTEGWMDAAAIARITTR